MMFLNCLPSASRSRLLQFVPLSPLTWGTHWTVTGWPALTCPPASITVMWTRAPLSASRPFAYVTPDSAARVLYLGVDEHIHELRLT